MSDVQRDVFPAVGTSITSMEKDGAPQAQGKPRWFLTQFLSTSRSAGVCSSTETEDSYACSQESSTSAAISLDEKKLHPYGNSTAYLYHPRGIPAALRYSLLGKELRTVGSLW